MSKLAKIPTKAPDANAVFSVSFESTCYLLKQTVCVKRFRLSARMRRRIQDGGGGWRRLHAQETRQSAPFARCRVVVVAMYTRCSTSGQCASPRQFAIRQPHSTSPSRRPRSIALTDRPTLCRRICTQIHINMSGLHVSRSVFHQLSELISDSARQLLIMQFQY